MLIGGLQKTTLIDYPGKIACTVFLVGCNFRCPWCYSSELVLPEKIKKHQKILEKDIFEFLSQRKDLLDGVVLCGGEPTIHKDLLAFVVKIRELGYKIKIDTNGSNPKMLKKLINNNLIDYVAMDIKAPLGLRSKISRYEEMTGVKINLEDIKKSIDILKQKKIDFEFRTTVAPGFKKQDILGITEDISDKNTKYFLQEFNKQKSILNPIILEQSVLKREEIEEVVQKIKLKFYTCKLR